MRNKHTCSRCLSNMVRFRIFKGNFYCFNCYQTLITRIPNGFSNHKTMEFALNKTYIIKQYIRKNHGKENRICVVNFPNVLAGKKVKIVIVGDTKVNKNGNKK